MTLVRKALRDIGGTEHPATADLQSVVGARGQLCPRESLIHVFFEHLRHTHRTVGWTTLGSPSPRPSPQYLFSVAQIFNLPYPRFVIGRTLLANGSWQVKN